MMERVVMLSVGSELDILLCFLDICERQAISGNTVYLPTPALHSYMDANAEDAIP